LGSNSHAQSIHVDFEARGTMHGLPTPNYGASSATPGVWNSVSEVWTSGLRAWDGTPTGVRLLLSDSNAGCGIVNNDPFVSSPVALASEEDGAFLDDRYAPNAVVVVCTFLGLESGDYVVDTVLVKLCPVPNLAFLVSVEGSADPEEPVFAAWSGAFVEGESFARHRVTVTDGRIDIRIV